MPRKEKIGLSGGPSSKPTLSGAPVEPPPEPPPQPEIKQVRVFEHIKFKPPWWDLDDTYNGNTTWIQSWSAGDNASLFKSSDEGTTWEWWAGTGNYGYYIPTSAGCAPTSPYYHVSNVPIGGVGNGYIDRMNDGNWPSQSITEGDHIAPVIYGIAGDFIRSSMAKVQYTIYDMDGTTILHDWGLLEVDVTSYIGTPNFPNLPDVYYMGPVWIVP